MTTKYQVTNHAGGWVTCLRAAEQKSGWLHYQLRDGTNGLTPRKNWRVKPAKEAAK